MNSKEQATNKVLQNLGIETLNAMQLASIEAFKSKSDMVLLSPTGSGKTVGFLLPILSVLKPDVEITQALILVPSRELALQIESVFKKMGTSFKINSCYGGHSISTEKNNLKHPAAILVGTPGRIADHLIRGRIDPSTINYLILDEFDKSLEMGFQTEMAAIIRDLRNIKQRILTSATPAAEIPSFTGIKKPVELNFLSDSPSVALTLKTVQADTKDKAAILLKLLCTVEGASLVFCNHREAVERVSDLLNAEKIAHGIYHGGMDQLEREKELIKFRNGSHSMLITTDLASRGLDIPEIRNVIHYQRPTSREVFTHRNGRTARMYAKGTAYFVLGEDEFIPEFITEEAPLYYFDKNANPRPKKPEWTSIYIDAGKKDKVNKVDIVGLMLQKGGLTKDELGRIEVLDYASFVAVKSEKARKTVELLKNETIKRKKVKIELSY